MIAASIMPPFSQVRAQETATALPVAEIEARRKSVATLELAKTFTDPKELEKYEVTSTASWFGWTIENEEISEAWKQNRRESRHTDSAKEAVSKGLKESINHLEQRNAYLTEKLKSPHLPDVERDFYQTEIAQNNTLIAHRDEQLYEFSSGSAPETQAVDQGKAHDLDRLVQSARNDLREDFFTIFRKHAELNRASAELKQLDDNLAARRQWQQDYDKREAQ